MNSKVSIFIAGVQRAGTSTLFEHMKRHPDLVAPSQKETHFFDDESSSWPRSDYRRLHAFYEVPSQSTRLAFEATPITIFWPPAVPRILDYNPAARFILLFRDPIERAWSNWRFGIEHHHDDVPFNVAIRDGRRRLEVLPPQHPKRRYYSYVERGMYGEQVARLLTLVDRTNVIFLRAEDLYERPSSVLDRIAAFLDISDFAPADRIWHNRSTVGTDLPEADDIRLLRDVYHEDLAVFTRLTGLDTASWLSNIDS